MCDNCDWEHYADLAEEMADDPDFDWVDFPLADVAEQIREREHVTEGQAEAIDGIASCKRD